jgi:O-antigen ligase
MNESVPDKVEKAFAILALFILTTPFTAILFRLLYREFGIQLPDGSRFWSDFLLVIYCCTIGLLVLHRKSVLPVLAQNRLLLFLIILALVSASWSFAPNYTITLGLIMVCKTALGLYLAVRFSPGDHLRLLLAALGFGALLSLFFVVLFPHYGISGDSWKGIYDTKNALGRYILLGTLGLVLLIKNEEGWRWIVYPALGLMLLLGLFSGSRAAEISFLATLVLLPFYESLHKGFNLSRKKLAAGLLLGCTGAAFLLARFDTVMSFLGKDATLTQRTDIWAAAVELGVYRPWTGYGYAAFWEEDVFFKWISFLSQTRAVNGHNGFLDLWLDLGLIGLAVFLAIFIGAFRKAIERARSGGSSDHLWPLVYLTFLVFINIAESELFIYYSFFWVLTSATIFSLGNSRFDVKANTAGNPGQFEVRS